VFLSPTEVVNSTSTDDPQKNVEYFNRRLDPAILMNGLPGVARWSVDTTYAVERLSDEGLLLKPVSEDLVIRDMFRAAADEAIADVGKAYYKLSDYMTLAGMGFTYGADRTVDRRGTMCSGLVYDAFTRAGFTISTYNYPLELLSYVAQATWDSVYDQTPWYASVVNGRTRIANQVVNCFAAFGRYNGAASCGDTSDTWKALSSSGTSIAPDNLLRVSQPLQSGPTYTDTGAGGYHWSRAVGGGGLFTGINEQQLRPGNTLTSSQGCTSAGCVSYGASSTPFWRVELQNSIASSYTTRQVFDF
jgi:hypothetical protein